MSWVNFRGNRYWLNRRISVAGQKALDVLAEDPDAKPNKIIARAYRMLGCKTLDDLEKHWCSAETILRDIREFKNKIGVEHCESNVRQELFAR